jgi:type IV/VI secretion system ImpK/VasF family protein
MHNITTHNQFTHHGKSNLMVICAMPLISFIITIKKTIASPDIAKIQLKIINEMKLFKSKCTENGFSEKIINAACYCLCSAIDEAVLSTSWRTQSCWVQHSLLSIFHNETWGGERFYHILEHMAQDPLRNIFLLELMYLLLSLGFEGKFYSDITIREEVRHRIFSKIKKVHGKITRRLSVHPKDIETLILKKKKSKSLRWMVHGSLGFFVAMYLFINIMLNINSGNTLKRLSHIGVESPITAYSELLDRPIIMHSAEGQNK